MSSPADTATTVRTLDLAVQGMTCASCAARIEKKLNRMDGVTAVVNYATGTAHVTIPVDLDPGELVATVERTGYTARLPASPEREPLDEAAEAPDDPELAALRQRLVVGTLLGVPVLLLAMIPALRFDNWQWISLTLASPVAVWAAWPLHRAAAINARHGAATMDTLVSLGVAGRVPVVAVRPAVHTDGPDRLGRRRHERRGRAVPRGRRRR
jgi:Cu+-exporting ATPase